MASEDDLFKWAHTSPTHANQDVTALRQHSDQVLAAPHDFFYSPDRPEITFKNGSLHYLSAIPSPTESNNTVYAHFFEARKSERAVVIVGHWNSPKETYNRLAKIYASHGISALRISMPYHDERRPPEMPIAHGLLSSDLGMTIQSFKQAVIDIRTGVDWLSDRGYKRIGIVGSSIGSAVALLSACHEPKITAWVGYLPSADVASAVWHGSATPHIRKAIESQMSLEDLKSIWACIAPESYLSLLSRANFSMHVGWAKYDTICPPEYTRKLISDSQTLNLNIESYAYRCGHNTLGTFPFLHWAGLRGIRFMKRSLSQ